MKFVDVECLFAINTNDNHLSCNIILIGVNSIFDHAVKGKPINLSLQSQG